MTNIELRKLLEQYPDNMRVLYKSYPEIAIVNANVNYVRKEENQIIDEKETVIVLDWARP